MPTNEELLRVRLVNGFPILFHVTNRTPGEQILRSGFMDGRKTDGTGRFFRGVWLSNRAMWFPGIRTREAMTFAVQFHVSLDDLEDYEAIEDEKPYREWIIPAAYIRAHAEVKIADEEDQL